MRRLLLTVSLLTLGLPLRAAEPCVTLDPKAVAALFDDLNFAMSSLDSKQVVQRYWPDAVLLPVASNMPRTDAASITSYYDSILTKRPRGHIDTRTIQTSCNLAVDTGTYTFSLMDDKGATSNEPARYTFIYQYRDGAWKILSQHSSAMAEVPSAAPEIQVAAVEPPKAQPASSQKPPKKKRKDYLDDAPVAAKPAKVPEAVKVAEAKPESKPAAEVKPPLEAKPAAKTSPATKPVAEVFPLVDAKPPAESRTTMFVNLTRSPPPLKFYPPEALKKNEHGSVNLKVCANSDGKVADSVEVLKSSGSNLLDQAAMNWARAATWVPATYNRQRVEGCANVDVAFEPLPALADSRT